MERFIEETLKSAGEEIMKRYGQTAVLYTKQLSSDVVTEADLVSNKVISSAISKKFPDHHIISEEGDTEMGGHEYCWYIDPLDGTRNFSTRTPLFGINLSLAVNGVVTYAAIYQPLTQEFIFAERGKGAYENGHRCQCSQQTEWNNSFGILTIKLTSGVRLLVEKIQEAANQTAWISMVGSSSINGAWVSTGRRDWFMTHNSNVWDLAAMSLIAKEAGAVVTNMAGEPYRPGGRGIVIANKNLHPQLLKFVKDSYNLS